MSLSRIQDRFQQLRDQNQKGLITYIMSGDSSAEVTRELLTSLPQAGADIIELGFPFSDPMADGATIQAAANRALTNGTTLHSTLETVRTFRNGDTETPLILMGYLNPVLAYGIESFCQDAAAAGVDGLLIVDVPVEEDEALKSACDHNELALVKLITPTTSTARAEKVLPHCSGFAYYVSITGITGTRQGDPKIIGQHIQQLRHHTELPIAMGFGIKTAEDIRRFAPHADALVVGSAIVNTIEENQDAPAKKVAEAVGKQIEELANALT